MKNLLVVTANSRKQTIKHSFYNSEIERATMELDKCYQTILIIRPDHLSDQYLQLLRSHSQCFIAYYWDAIDIIPRERDIVHYFDRVLNVDPVECDKYDLNFGPISIPPKNNQARPGRGYTKRENALNTGFRKSQLAKTVFERPF